MIVSRTQFSPRNIIEDGTTIAADGFYDLGEFDNLHPSLAVLIFRDKRLGVFSAVRQLSLCQ